MKNDLREAIRRLPVSVRATAERQLTALFRDASTLDGLCAIVVDRQRQMVTRARALWALRQLNADLIRRDLPALLEERPNSKLFLWEVAKTIVALGGSDLVPVVTRMLDDKASWLREIAVWVLGFIGGEASRGRLERALAHDRDPGVRAQAAESLGVLHGPESVPALVGAIRDRSPRVRSSAAEALVKIGDRSVLWALRELVEHRAGLSAVVSGEITRVIRRAKATVARRERQRRGRGGLE